MLHFAKEAKWKNLVHIECRVSLPSCLHNELRVVFALRPACIDCVSFTEPKDDLQCRLCRVEDCQNFECARVDLKVIDVLIRTMLAWSRCTSLPAELVKYVVGYLVALW